MTRLIAVLVACTFALSSGYALASTHAGAKPMDPKSDVKKDASKKDTKKKKKKAAATK